MFSSFAACCLASFTSRNLPWRKSAISRALRSSPSTITSSPALRHVRTGPGSRPESTGRPRVDRLAVLVEHRAHAAEHRAGQHDVAALERARLHEHRRHRAAALVEARLDHDALGGRVASAPSARAPRPAAGSRSSSSSMPWPVFADTGTNMRVAAPLLGHDLVREQLLLARARDSRRACRSCSSRRRSARWPPWRG